MDSAAIGVRFADPDQRECGTASASVGRASDDAGAFEFVEPLCEQGGRDSGCALAYLVVGAAPVEQVAHVWPIAKARATIAGPSFESRTPRRNAAFQSITTLSPRRGAPTRPDADAVSGTAGNRSSATPAPAAVRNRRRAMACSGNVGGNWASLRPVFIEHSRLRGLAEGVARFRASPWGPGQLRMALPRLMP
jgi:hypothetical protein